MLLEPLGPPKKRNFFHSFSLNVSKVILRVNAPSRRAPLKVWQALYLRHICGSTFRYRFFTFFWTPRNSRKSFFFVKNMHTFCYFWDPFGSLRATFGRLLVTKVVQRLQKVSQTRPNGFKTPQKGSGKTKWLAFLKKFDVFSTISSFCIVLASIWLLLALIGSCWLLLAPIAFYLLLLPPIVSYCLLAAPIVSYWLLMAPLGS